MKNSGGDVEVIVKEGWHHGFYGDTPPEKCKGCVHFNKCEVNFPEGWVLNDKGFITESLQEPFFDFFKLDLKEWTEKFTRTADKPRASNELYRKPYMKMYKKCGAKGATVGGDHGKNTVDITVPFFVNA